MSVRKGTFVQIEKTLLEPSQRAPQVPADTAAVPYMLWVNGYLEEDARVGDMVTVRTLIGRRVSGRLVNPEPAYDHDFGRPLRELLEIGTDFAGGGGNE